MWPALEQRCRPSIEYVPTGKPNPSRYLQAAARLGVDPAACVVIEDAPACIAAGRAAGATVLARGVPRPAHTFDREELELLCPELAVGRWSRCGAWRCGPSRRACSGGASGRGRGTPTRVGRSRICMMSPTRSSATTSAVSFPETTSDDRLAWGLPGCAA
ncbi:HAD family hydrolase [Actinomadura geliboluensis]|uniref:HAD family hydrolase n=1 Tax=Actinomadura geliboluensis TaxID=882440 RepID=UPI0037198CB5